MLGDFVTLGILTTISHLLYEFREDFWWGQFAVMCTYALVAPTCGRHANPGHLVKKEFFVGIVSGNFTVVQCQAVVVGFLAALCASCLNFFTTRDIDMSHFLLMTASSVGAASIASLFLAAVMIGTHMGF